MILQINGKRATAAHHFAFSYFFSLQLAYFKFLKIFILKNLQRKIMLVLGVKFQVDLYERSGPYPYQKV